MSAKGITWSVFTKPWKTMPLGELGAHVRALGFDAIELPVRPEFQVEPANISRDLPRAASILADEGVRIASVAGPTDETAIAACAEAGVPIIRICLNIGPEGYMASEARYRREFDALVPILARHGVAIGIQNHCGQAISSAMGVRHLIESFDPAQIGAVLDAAHASLEGEQPELAIDIVWSHLRMMNLKNAYRRRKNGPEAAWVEWESYWTTGRQGFASWPRYAAELTRRGYASVVCLTAEYNDLASTDRLIAEDVAFAKSLFG